MFFVGNAFGGWQGFITHVFQNGTSVVSVGARASERGVYCSKHHFRSFGRGCNRSKHRFRSFGRYCNCSKHRFRRFGRGCNRSKHRFRSFGRGCNSSKHRFRSFGQGCNSSKHLLPPFTNRLAPLPRPRCPTGMRADTGYTYYSYSAR